MAWFGDFKTFIMRGNVLDLAVGVIIGAAFGKIVTSLVSDILMPVIGIATKGVDVAKLSYDVYNPVNNEVLVTLKYGAFLQATIDFLIIAFCVFWLIKLINIIHKKPPEDPKLTTQEMLLTEIRDLLKKQQDPADATVKMDVVERKV